MSHTRGYSACASASAASQHKTGAGRLNADGDALVGPPGRPASPKSTPSPVAVQVLLRSIEKEKLPLALKGASEKLRDLFFGNLSERAGKMLREEIANLGPVKLRDVDEAQASIVLAAKELAASGEIQISQSKDDEMIV